MHLNPSDPDIATLLTRIKNGDLQLQPDFQRGEVWSYGKKQILIDSILRGWHIPPIHVIEALESGRQEVLDGQQRLVAIRDFANGKVRIDGRAEPFDEEINRLDKLNYSDLPDFYRRRFDQFTIRVIRITGFKPAEPAELFFRLNQPVGLTTAEKRNAFFGETRNQIREVVSEMESVGLGKGVIGFSNSRMAYDDVLARVAMTVDARSLNLKIDAGKLADQYRSEKPFLPETMTSIRRAICILADLKPAEHEPIKFNKATLYSWILFVIRANNELRLPLNGEAFIAFIVCFEQLRRHGASAALVSDKYKSLIPHLLAIYEDRSTSRVGDVSSVVLRDLVIWVMYLLLDFNFKRDWSDKSRLMRLSVLIEAWPLKTTEGVFECEEWLSSIAQEAAWGMM